MKSARLMLKLLGLHHWHLFPAMKFTPYSYCHTIKVHSKTSICNVYIYINYPLVLWSRRFRTFVELLGVTTSNHYSPHSTKPSSFLFYFETERGCHGVKGQCFI